MTKDLTVGHPGRVMILFALPMVVSVVFQQLYNMADNVIAGQFIGDDALSAVSISYPVTMIYTAVALGLNIGCSVVISQLFGSGQHGRMKTAVSTSLLSTTAMALLLTALGLLFCPALLRAMQTPESYMADTLIYLRIYTGGLAFIFLYNICTAVFTALGDTITPLIFLVISSLSNIGLDIWFVTAFSMGVAGLAWATFLCQGVAALASLVVLLLRLRSIPSEPWPKFSPGILRTIATLAIPGICQKSFVSLGNVFIQSVVNSYDATVPGIISGFSSATKLVYFVVTLTSTVSSSMASFTAQNIGAGHMERLKQGLRTAYGICLAIVLPSTLFFVLMPRTAMGIFVPAESTAVIEAGTWYLWIVAPFMLVVALKQVCDGVLQGAGSAREFMATTFSDLILRVALAYILPLWMGHLGIWWAWPIGWILGTAISLWFYLRGRWKNVHLLDNL